MSLLNKQNYKMLSDITSIAWEDLEDIGITRLGHQKRFMLGIKRLIDIDKGHYQPNPNKINNPSIKQSKSTIERCNSFEHNQFIHPTTSGGDSSTYATLRKPHCSPNSLISSKQRNGSAGTYTPALSFRLPPPLSSAIMNSSSNNYQQPISTSRTRSLENINMNQRKLEAHINQVNSFIDS
jgi:hypothetical protein